MQTAKVVSIAGIFTQAELAREVELRAQLVALSRELVRLRGSIQRRIADGARVEAGPLQAELRWNRREAVPTCDFLGLAVG